MTGFYINHSVEELQSIFSDFYKDLYKHRPRFATVEQWKDKEWLIKSIDSLHLYMKKLSETFAGREELRENGWIIPETDPVLKRHAQFLADEREAKIKEFEKSY